MKSIFKYAAEAGVPMGIYLTIMSACMLLSIKVPALPMALAVLVPGLPFFTAWLMKRIVTDQPAYRKVAPLWLAGIYTFIFGTLICCFLSLLYVMLFEPHFVREYMEMSIANIQATPMAADYAPMIEEINRAISSHALPTGMEFVTSMGWATCFFGSLLSLLIAAIMSRRTRKLQQMVR